MGFDGFSKDDEYIEEGPLPGFRFHPTDEELVGFYLRRMLDKKPICLELIKQIDIYRFDPWDLPKTGSTSGEKEWYFFCKRGRKYRNSIRPNRVTGSGFWKATGVDKPVYSHGGEGKDCIGLKKTLVYYRGSAGKGTKTDWMMHEFRLPSNNDTNTVNNAPSAPEAEIWTLCRIVKRNVSQRKQFANDVKKLAAKRVSTEQKMTRIRSVESNANREAFISIDTRFGHNYHNDHKPLIDNNNTNSDIQRHHQLHVCQSSSCVEVEQQQAQVNASFSNLWASPEVKDLFTFDNWDDLASVVKFGVDSTAYDVNNRVL